MASLGNEVNKRVKTLDMPFCHLNYKGYNNEDKGYFKLTKDIKKKLLKKMLHQNLLGRKSQATPLKLNIK
jgi:hypothetical protein